MASPEEGYQNDMATLLWLAAVVLVVLGIITLITGNLILGLLLIVVGLLVGPGGVSIFSRRHV